MPKKLPTLNESGKLPPADSSFAESVKVPAPKLTKGQDMDKSSLNHSIIDKFSGTFRISEEADQNG